MSKSQENELPRKCVIENMSMTMGSIITYLLLPIYVYLINKTARKHNKWKVRTHKITMINTLNGYSCADLLRSALIQHGIAPAPLSLQWIMFHNNVALEFSFLVPSTQKFLADVMVRQYAKHTSSFLITSEVQYLNGQPSTKYSDKTYQPKPFNAKTKSVDWWIGNLLFGSPMAAIKLNKDKPQYENQTASAYHPKFTKNKKHATTQKATKTKKHAKTFY